MTEKDLYSFYNEKVKVIYSWIEAKNNNISVELLFEIHAAFDHLKGYHLGEIAEEEACKEAMSHLRRGMLDAFKLKLKYFNTDFDMYIGKNSDILEIIDNGEFTKDLYKNKADIENNGTHARMSESQGNIDDAFENWCRVSVLIDGFSKKYFSEEKILWAKSKKKTQIIKERIIGIVIGLIVGVLGSIIATIIYNNYFSWTPFEVFFKSPWFSEL